MARAAALRGAKLAALLAVPDRDQRVPDRGRAPAQADAADRPRPARRSPRPPGTPLVESTWVEPYPDERLGLEDGRAGPRGPLRAPRGRRAGLRRGAAAPAAQPARRAHPARGAGLLGPGDRRGARDDGRRGQQRHAARPQDGRRAPARRAASRPPCARSATSACARSSRATWTPWRAATSTPSSSLLAQDAVWSMPPLGAWYRGRRRDRRLPGHRAAQRRLALAPPARARQRAGRGRLLRLGRERADLSRRSPSTC